MALVFAANYELSQLAKGKLIPAKFGNSTLILSLKWPYGSSNGYSHGTSPGAGHSKGSGSVPCLAHSHGHSHGQGIWLEHGGAKDKAETEDAYNYNGAYIFSHLLSLEQGLLMRAQSWGIVLG